MPAYPGDRPRGRPVQTRRPYQGSIRLLHRTPVRLRAAERHAINRRSELILVWSPPAISRCGPVAEHADGKMA